jgi:hypothetical protein
VTAPPGRLGRSPLDQQVNIRNGKPKLKPLKQVSNPRL